MSLKTPRPQKTAPGRAVARRFTTAGADPYASVAWERRDARIGPADAPFFFQPGVEVPASWTDTALNVVASKYFRGHQGTPEREGSVRAMIARITDTIAGWGREDGYFASAADAAAFRDELAWIILHQRMAFNSPVWFNVGWREDPTASACFVLGVEDSMDGIMDLARTEAHIFKGGAGAGFNLSPLRAAGERLSGGGESSGPMSFLRGLDAFAGAIRSGGATRRAAVMVLLDADHPDIEAFIDAKAHEEEKARALVREGYDGAFGGEASASVAFQNANHSVRATDAFMRAVESDSEWELRGRRDDRVNRTVRARDLFRKIAAGAWATGDPGMQFDTTINAWHTVPASGRLVASNPCGETHVLDGLSCQLASFNLLSFLDEANAFDTEGFRHAVAVTMLAQDIMIERAGYPTPAIADMSRRFRPIGLGFSNLGAALMVQGMAYDSPDARAFTAAVSALLTGEAYAESARIARDCGGPFADFAPNAGAMAAVLRRHADAMGSVPQTPASSPILAAAGAAWADANAIGAASGWRNCQATVVAPAGTTGFMMDNATTGIEPALALVSYKSLVGGGTLRLANAETGRALRSLGYAPDRAARITAFIEESGTVTGCADLDPVHLPVFDTALAAPGGRVISPMGHIGMLAAVAPFISGSVSKTANVPADATVEDIEALYLAAWRSGVKCLAIYRDGSKANQPVNVKRQPDTAVAAMPADAVEERIADLSAALAAAQAETASVRASAERERAAAASSSHRHRLPDERVAVTHKFTISGHEGYLTVGLYPDGTPGELFIKMSKEGSTISGLVDAWATAISVSLQHGATLSDLVTKFAHTRFEPAGFTGNQEIPMAKSIVDYVVRWMGARFLPASARDGLGLQPRPDERDDVVARLVACAVADGDAKPAASAPAARPALRLPAAQGMTGDAPPCSNCGSITVRSGSCHACPSCGTTTGCG